MRAAEAAGTWLAGFQGERGAWSEMACLAWDRRLSAVPCYSFADVFDGVERGAFDRGLVPIENSLAGAVAGVADLLIERDVSIVGEVLLPIRQCLLALPGTRLDGLRAVYSHPQALSQCRAFVSANGLEARPFYDTAGAARWVMSEGLRDAAAIASPLAAKLYGLEVLAEDVADRPGNRTRFVAISTAPGRGGNKCSLALATEDRPGALAAALAVFAAHGISLTRIESRLGRNDPASSTFLLDFLGEAGAPPVEGALAALERECLWLKVLGFYPASPR